ncbi:MAG: hypothetical protein ACRC8P_03960 [Spiroplasma sp.]
MQLKNSNVKNSLILTLILLTLSITLVALITEFISSVLDTTTITGIIKNDHNLWAPMGPWAKIWETLSSFTTQSNILVLIFFSLILVNHLSKTKIKWINNNFSLAITIYISITLIIFWTTLFKPMLETTNFQSTFGLINFINTFLLHLFTPIITIIFYLLTAGDKKLLIKPTSTKVLPIIISYMFIYLAYVLIKGTFVGEIKMKAGNAFIDYSYPYFFLNIKTNLNSFFIYFFIILFLFFLLFAIYYTYNNWKYQKELGQTFTNKKELLKAILF